MIFSLIISFIFIEFLIFILVKIFKKNFKWIITHTDEFSGLNSEKLDIFLSGSYSEDLGWDRKPSTKGIEKNKDITTNFEITANGFRKSCNKFSHSKIATFGDSYAFCRYVNDDETWQHYLEHKINTHVRNFGVGNYGIDQAFLKFDKTQLDNENEFVMFAVVPETISRVHSYWKHYLEFGNILSFKPRFLLNKNNEVIKINNYLSKYKTVSSIRNNIEEIKLNDFFYKIKFLKRMFKFPYSISFLRYPKLNIQIFGYLFADMFFKKLLNDDLKKNFYNQAVKKIIIKNIIEADNYYLIDNMKLLLEKIIYKYDKIINKIEKKMLILIIPQKYDLLELKQKNYKSFFKHMSKNINILDLTDVFVNQKNINSLYIEDNYAGHLSKIGNQLVASEVYKYLKEENIKW